MLLSQTEVRGSIHASGIAGPPGDRPPPWVWSAGRFDGVTRNGFSNKGDLENVGAPFLVSYRTRVWGGTELLSPRGGLVGPCTGQQLFLGAVWVPDLAWRLTSTETAVLVSAPFPLCALPY